MDISRETFKISDGNARELILFDSIESLREEVLAYIEANEACHKDIRGEVRKVSRYNKYLSGGGGIIGGFLAALGFKFLP